MNKVCAMGLLFLAGTASGQIVSQEVQAGFGGQGVRCGEVAIVASLHSCDLIVAWNRLVSTGTTIEYALSVNCAAAFSLPRLLDPPACGGSEPLGFDPMVARSLYSGKLWVGGIHTPGTFGPAFVSRKEPGASVLIPPVPISECPATGTYNDKPFIYVGPRVYGQAYSDTSERMFAGWSRRTSTYLQDTLFFNQSTGTGIPGSTWPSPSVLLCGPGSPPTHVIAKGAFPVILTGPLHRGRLFTAYSPDAGQTLPPAFTWSNDEGVTWQQTEALDTFGSGQTPILPLPNGGDLGAFTNATTWPSVAFSPWNSDKLYVAFVGQVDGTGAVDLFIATSSDAGSTFLVEQRHRMFDSYFQLPGDPTGVPMHEFMPSIAVDGRGGINLLFCRKAGPGQTNAPVSIRYARWINAAALAGPPQFLYEVAAPFATSSGTPVGQGGNDYQMLSATRCWVYLGYAKPDGSSMGSFVRRVFVGGTDADVDCSDATDSADFVQFASDFSQGNGTADVNGDTHLDMLDVSAFVASYNAATNPP